MKRFPLALVTALLAVATAAAQDMPLSQVLIDGEGWKKVEESGGRGPGEMVATHSPDGSTVFRWSPESGRFLAAKQAGTTQPFAPYAPLRTRRGQKSIEVTGLTTDKDGRVYAATGIGVQVFDPTGRLCGVLTPAAPGRPENLAFEGDRLTLWVGDTKYARKLRTAGAK
jgi:hypothetical protein